MKQPDITALLIEHMDEDGCLSLDNHKTSQLLIYLQGNAKAWEIQSECVENIKKIMENSKKGGFE